MERGLVFFRLSIGPCRLVGDPVAPVTVEPTRCLLRTWPACERHLGFGARQDLGDRAVEELADEGAAQQIDYSRLLGREVHLLEGAGDLVAPDPLDRVPARRHRGACSLRSWGPVESRGILTSSSTGGFFSWSRQPVAAKQHMVSSSSRTSSLRKFLKSGGSFQSKNSEKKWCRGPLPRPGSGKIRSARRRARLLM